MAEQKQVLCRTLFDKVIKELEINNAENNIDFFIGFMVGQAEKVYLNSCSAAMFVPSAKYFYLYYCNIIKICNVYNLNYSLIPTFDERYPCEFWLYSPKVKPVMTVMSGMPRKTEQWNTLRGILCGIPVKEIDVNFYKNV